LKKLSEYDKQRDNFKNQSLKHFEFLVTEFGFEQPTINEKQADYSDYISYKSTILNKTVQIENHYHSNDYGLEFNLWNSLTDLNHSNRNMLEYYFKENQDVEQTYIKKVAKTVKPRQL
jgi:hypothetical protein